MPPTYYTSIVLLCNSLSLVPRLNNSLLFLVIFIHSNSIINV